MGSVFSTPKPAAPVIISAPTIPPEVEEKPAEKEEDNKINRNKRYGRSSTIATSNTGLLNDKSFSVKRKNLLGE